MPQYILLLYSPVEGGPSPEEMAAEFPRWGEYTQSLKDAGLFAGGDPLQGAESATTVRVRDGETQITDGPFAETKELLVGYYLLDAPDLDTVLEHAARVPNVHYGSIEVRPIWDMTQMPAGMRAGPGKRMSEGWRPGPSGDPAATVERTFREERPAVLATLIRHVGNFQLAEDAVQDAFAAAVATWPRDGVPANPGAWITVTARRKAIDRLRRERATADRTARLGRAGAARRPGAPPRGRGERGARRSAAPDLHLLSPGARDARAGRADAEDARRAQHHRDRSGLPGQRDDDGATARPCQAQDRRCAHPLPGARRRRSSPAVSAGCCQSSI